MNQYFLGIDIGATKSHALIADKQGRAVGFGEYGPGSHEVVGYEGLQAVLHTIVNTALASAGIGKADIAGAGFGIAGYDWPGDAEPHRRVIASLGLSAPYALVNDTIIGLVAGATEGWGVGVVSGTGCNCWGRDRQGREGRMTGGGEVFAEYAGGGDLIAKAIQAVALAWGRRGPATRLTQAFLKLTGATDEMDLLEGLYRGHYHLTSANAPLVFQVAAEGDEVAQEVIRWAGRQLGSLAIGVIRQLGFEPLDFEVVQIGSLYNGSPMLGETMLATIHEVAPGARAVRLAAPPVVGGVLLGMEQAGVDYPPLRDMLIKTTKGYPTTGNHKVTIPIGPAPSPTTPAEPDNSAIYALLTHQPALASVAPDLLHIYRELERCFASGGTLFLCGNGGSMADALHISGELLKSYARRRALPEHLRDKLAAQPNGDLLTRNLEPGLRAVVLGANVTLSSAVANDMPDRDMGYAQELLALARPGDVLLGISTSGNARNVIYAAQVARALGLTVIAFTGESGGRLVELSDIALRVPAARTDHIQELHIQCYHALCKMLENNFFK